ncbi:MAG TPA: hypothetical protein VF843_03765 [Streptosporangiaceae bacterium]
MTKGSPVPGGPDGGDRPGEKRSDPEPAALRFGRRRPASAGGASQQASAGGAGRPANAGSGYTYLSYMLGGMLLYGFIGWLIGRWTHQAYLLPVGMIAGLALSIVLIIYRVTRSGPGT